MVPLFLGLASRTDFRPFRALRSLLVLLLCLSVGGCATPPLTIHESPKGAVYLEALPTETLRAAHPVSLDSDTLAQILYGIRVHKLAFLLQHLMPNKPKLTLAFSEEEALFLGPLLESALARATADQMVTFRAFRESSQGRETTAGALFVKDHALYATLTQYRVRVGTANTAIKGDRHLRDSTGLKERKVVFVPKGLERTDLTPKAGLMGPPHLKTLILDYVLLAKLMQLEPEPAPVPPAPAGPARPSESVPHTPDREPSVEERLKQQDKEIEALREELRSLQQELRKRNAD